MYTLIMQWCFHIFRSFPSLPLSLFLSFSLWLYSLISGREEIIIWINSNYCSIVMKNGASLSIWINGAFLLEWTYFSFVYMAVGCWRFKLNGMYLCNQFWLRLAIFFFESSCDQWITGFWEGLCAHSKVIVVVAFTSLKDSVCYVEYLAVDYWLERYRKGLM